MTHVTHAKTCETADDMRLQAVTIRISYILKQAYCRLQMPAVSSPAGITLSFLFLPCCGCQLYGFGIVAVHCWLLISKQTCLH